jgi:hypothetical protein
MAKSPTKSTAKASLKAPKPASAMAKGKKGIAIIIGAGKPEGKPGKGKC